MDIISKIALEIQKEERVYRFEMPIGAPFGECYDAAFQCLNKIAEMSKEAADKVKPAEEVQPTVVE